MWYFSDFEGFAWVFLAHATKIPSWLRVPLQRLFYLEWGEFKGIFLADRSVQCWADRNSILLDTFELQEAFHGLGQYFRGSEMPPD